jgi:hypothetical protein
MADLDLYRQIPRAAADLEHPLACLKLRLIHELPVGGRGAEQSREGVV